MRDRQKTYLYVPLTSPHAILDPVTIPKFEHQLIVPPAMPRVSEINLPDGSAADFFEITVKQFNQQILPLSMGLNPTKVWSYVKADVPGTYNYPGFTIEAQIDKPTVVKWVNGLVDEAGNFLPHLLPVDQTLHWANPPGPMPDMQGMIGTAYTGPVPVATHVHGAHTYEYSDGHPQAWFLPAAANIPQGYFTEGSLYAEYKKEFGDRWGIQWEPGSSTYIYPNDRAGTTWFHDHVLGMTRLNVYAGPAAFYLIRGGDQDLPAGTLPGPGPAEGSDPFGVHYEIPIAIQDRTF